MSLLEAEQYCQLLATGVRDGLWDWRIREGQVYVSPAFKSILGIDGDSEKIAFEDFRKRIDNQYLEAFESKIEECLQQKNDLFQMEFPARDNFHSYTWVHMRGSVLIERGEVTRIAGSLTNISEQRFYEEQLMQSAMYDTLTGLPNKILFFDRLEIVIEKTSRTQVCNSAILYIDLDRFKIINESLGHTVGDRFLIQMAEALRKTARKGDTVARLGGDEFCLLLDGIESENEARGIARDILSNLSKTQMIDNRELYSTASMGIVLIDKHYKKPEEILRDADSALYKAKLLGRSRIEIFDEVMHKKALRLMELDNRVNLALEKQEFQLYYQPIFDTTTHAIVGAEALLRWLDKKEGMISPAEFIPIIEDSGKIISVGYWIIEEACRTIAHFLAQEKPLELAVNLSVVQVRDPGFLHKVKGILQSWNIPKHTLKFEITESLMLEDSERIRFIFDELKRFGVKLALDDFGTGYSSLKMLKRLQFDTLKIDKSFIDEIHTNQEDAQIVLTIVDMAHNLGLKVVAEGIEKKEQLDFLKLFHCDFIQGYYFSKPLPFADFDKKLNGQ